MDESMKRRRVCSERRNEKSKEVSLSSGLLSLPDEVALNCLAHVSRLDLAALAVASKCHRSLVVSPQLWDLRRFKGSTEPSLYVCLHILPEPNPRWFILNPMQRRLKPIRSNRYEEAQSLSSFVVIDWGIFIIGGIRNGEPTADVFFLDCFEHSWKRLQSMYVPRASATACLIGKKIYVFGGCGDEADSFNWVEVFDLETQTWEVLFVFTPKMPLNIEHSVVIDKELVYAVDDEGQDFSFSPSKRLFWTSGMTDSKPGHRSDWCVIGKLLFCRGTRGRILWCDPEDGFDWEEVKGLEDFQDSFCGSVQPWGLGKTKVQYDINKLCPDPAGNIVIFWNNPDSLELWSAVISLESCNGGLEIKGKIEWSGAVFKLDPLSKSSYSVNVLYSAYVNA
ncbi:unnamed protein product [Brassica oleracea var. botrytis]|uniref:F-box domain-containing protein n=2 Tax=Brassica TaxID=3705 RepID=A0A3P6CJL8_BRAOL|nr:unnamed protein product [Brassica napus]VDD18927.1 unnamed protein product [Brassica oleracea]